MGNTFWIIIALLIALFILGAFLHLVRLLVISALLLIFAVMIYNYIGNRKKS